MTALPKDGQHGPAICVPSHVEKTTTISRRYGSDQMIRVQLKRKISYKRYDENKLVNKAHVQDALNYLVRNNSMLLFKKEWIKPLLTVLEENEEQINDETIECTTKTDKTNHEMYMDSCLQPMDFGQEVLDQHFDNNV